MFIYSNSLATLRFVRLLVSCLVLSGICTQLGRSDEPLLLIVKADAAATIIEVDGLVEGLTASTEVWLKNETGKSYDHLVAVASCGCLKIRDVDGKRWDAGSKLRANVVYVPTANRFDQELKISGVVDDLDRQEISTLRIRGKVEPPVQLSKYAVLPQDLDNGEFAITLTANPLIEVDFGRIRLGDSPQGVKLSLDEKSSNVKLTFLQSEVKKKSSILHLHIPYRWQENGYTYTVPIKFEPEPFEVIPRSAVFRSTEVGDQKNTVVRSKILVRGRASKIYPESVKVSIRDLSGETVLSASDFDIRSVSEHSVLIEFALPKKLVSSESGSLLIRFDDSQHIQLDFTTNF